MTVMVVFAVAGSCLHFNLLFNPEQTTRLHVVGAAYTVVSDHSITASMRDGAQSHRSYQPPPFACKTCHSTISPPLTTDVQYDKGFTDEEIEANVTTYFRGFSANTTLNSLPTESSAGIGTKDRELIALAFLDAAVCIAAYCAALAATAAQAALARAAERNVLTVSDYSVQVQGLPTSATSEQVRPLILCLTSLGSGL